MGRKSVAYIYPYAFQYRLGFHEKLKSILSDHNVDYYFIYCSNPHFPSRGDFIPPQWGTDTKCTYLRFGSIELRYQHALRKALQVDLAILQQENGLLMNYPLQLMKGWRKGKVAFFGHGRNFQGRGATSLRERFKRFWINKVDWWFAYTQRSANIVAQSGFPADRITAFNNAIDTSMIQAELATIPQAERDQIRAESFAGSHNIGVYIGGLYDLKRIDFMIESAILVRERLPDFQLLVIGGGADAHLIKAVAERHPWIHALGPQFGRKKTLLASLGRVFIMPGLVGLGVLDSFVYGTPMVTTDLPYHSPEIDYLKDGVNGVIVREADSVDAYAAAVERILVDDAWRDHLRAGATDALDIYTIEAMAQRFADGVIKALDLGSR